MGKAFTPRVHRFLPKRSPNKHRFPRRQKPAANRCGICRAPLTEKATACPNCGCGICQEMSI